jgi:hypothetical protein
MSARNRLGTIILSMLVLASSCTDGTIRAVNSVPEATITSPANEDQFPLGSSLTIRGSVFDANNSASQLSTTWLLDGVEVCTESVVEGNGTTLCELDFNDTGTYRVLLEARDPDNATGSAFVDIAILQGAAPVVTLVLPVNEDLPSGRHSSFRGAGQRRGRRGQRHHPRLEQLGRR